MNHNDIKSIDRDWIHGHVEEWYNSTSPILLIIGDPGSGKTHLARELFTAYCRKSRGRQWALINAFHACEYYNFQSIDPIRVFANIAAQFTEHLPGYAITQSSTTPNISVNIRAKSVENSRITGIGHLELSGASPRRAFNELIREPLRAIADRMNGKSAVALIDGLDESLAENQMSPDTLAGVLAIEMRRQVLGFKLIMLSQPFNGLDNFPGATILNLSADDKSSHDIARYLTLNLGGQVSTQVIRKIEVASEGNFAYAEFAIRSFLSDPGGLGADLIVNQPTGLDEFYERSFDRRISVSGRNWIETIRPLLGLLSQARGQGLLREQLLEMIKVPPSKIDDALTSLTSYLRVAPDGRIRLFHTTLARYLERLGPYHVYPVEAIQKIIDELKNPWRESWAECEDSYTLCFLLDYIEAALHLGVEPDIELICNVDFLQRICDELKIGLLYAQLKRISALFASDRLALLVRLMYRHIAFIENAANINQYGALSQDLLLQADLFDEEVVASSARKSLEASRRAYLALNWVIAPPEAFTSEMLGSGGIQIKMMPYTIGNKHYMVTVPQIGQIKVWDLDEGSVANLQFPRYLVAGVHGAAITVHRGRPVLTTLNTGGQLDFFNLLNLQQIGEPITLAYFNDIISLGSLGGRLHLIAKKNQSTFARLEFDDDFNPVGDFEEHPLGWVIEGFFYGRSTEYPDGVFYITTEGGHLISLHQTQQGLQSTMVLIDGPRILDVSFANGSVLVLQDYISESRLSVGDIVRHGYLMHARYEQHASISSAVIHVSDQGRTSVAISQWTPKGSVLQIWHGTDQKRGPDPSSVVSTTNEQLTDIQFVTYRGQPVILTAGVGTIKSISLGVSQLKPGRRLIPTEQHLPPATVIDAWEWDGKKLVATGHDNGLLAVWSADNGDNVFIVEDLNNRRKIYGLAFCKIRGQDVLMSAGDWSGMQAMPLAEGPLLDLDRSWSIDGILDDYSLGRGPDGRPILSYCLGDSVDAVDALNGENVMANTAWRSDFRLSMVRSGLWSGRAVVVTKAGNFTTVLSIDTGETLCFVRARESISAIQAGIVAGKNVLIVGCIDNSVTIYNESGTVIFNFSVDSCPRACAVANNRLFVGCDAAIYAFDLFWPE